jgi:hypothetical protein
MPVIIMLVLDGGFGPRQSEFFISMNPFTIIPQRCIFYKLLKNRWNRLEQEDMRTANALWMTRLRAYT